MFFPTLNTHARNCFLLLQFLQNLGKVDRTADDIFDEHLQNFTRQQNAANKLQKEFNNYIRCVRGELDHRNAQKLPNSAFRNLTIHHANCPLSLDSSSEEYKRKNHRHCKGKTIFLVHLLSSQQLCYRKTSSHHMCIYRARLKLTRWCEIRVDYNV